VKLYIKRVFIADENIDLIPHYLRFLRGIVDSADLPLNISRDVLQHNPQLEKIRNAISKRVLAELKKKKNESVDDYLGFWDNFGGVLKEGLCEADSEREKLLEVCMFKSALHDKMISLDDYINNCHREDKTIYYLSGDDPNKLRLSPQIEGFLSKNIDVLLFTDSVDDFWVNVSNNYQTYEIKSVTRSNIDLEQTGDSKEDKLSAEQKDDKSNQLISYFKLILGNLVKDVQISKKLTSSPACLAVSDGAMDIRMERFLIEQKQLKSSSTKILELNPKHKIIQKINNDIGINDTSKSKDNETLVKLIFDQACIIEGEPVSDVHDFVQRLNDTLERNL
jgi:molecular chaperone HtpG